MISFFMLKNTFIIERVLKWKSNLLFIDLSPKPANMSFLDLSLKVTKCHFGDRHISDTLTSSVKGSRV